MWIIGIVLLGLGGLFYYLREQSKNKVMNIKYNETSKISELMDTYKSIANELGEGNFSQVVELKGVSSCNQPLEAEFSGREVVYYKAEVYREYEVTVEKRDNEGRVTRNVERRSETVSNNERFVPFLINDGSGSIKVDLEGAEKVAQQSVDRFDSQAPSGFSLNFGYSGDSKTIGFRYKEHVIPVGAQLYVLGEASDRRGGGISVIKPADTKNHFIVSTKSEEELIKSSEGSATWYLVGAIVSAIAGVGLIIAGFIAK